MATYLSGVGRSLLVLYGDWVRVRLLSAGVMHDSLRPAIMRVLLRRLDAETRAFVCPA